MAGIGFTLKRVISRGDVSSFAVGSLSGVFIVAGPSLMAMATMWLITGPFLSVGRASVAPFTALLVYTFAATIILTGGVQYAFTRYVADAIHRGEERVAVGALLRLLGFLVPVAFALGALAAGLLPLLPGAGPASAMAISGALAATVSAMWVLVLFSSMLRAYARILGLYAGGMALAVASVWIFGDLGPAGLTAAFALSYAALDAGLLVLILAERKPARPPRGSATLAMIKRHPALFWYGIVYYLANWMDKIVFWLAAGQPVGASVLKLSPAMDSVAYVASLTMIPGLVFFVVSSETDYFAALRRFLSALAKKPYRIIEQNLSLLSAKTRSALVGLGLFQAGACASVVLAAPAILADGSFLPFALYAVGALFHLLTLAAQNFLFYIEAYEQALAGALWFLAASLAVSLASVYLVPGGLPGLGYLAGTGISAAVSIRSLLLALRGLDRFLYTRSS